MDDPNTPDPVQPDPLLKAGAFIDPTPASNGTCTPKIKPDALAAPQPSDQKPASSGPVVVTDQANRPDWLPSDWAFKETLRTSGASAGTRDKYFIHPAGHRFRSKKEVMNFIETGITPKKRKNADSDATDNTPRLESGTPKRKKNEVKAKVSMTNFNFDDVPEMVKWEMTGAYEGTWRPLINGVDRVPESSKQDWTAAFTYLSIQNCSKQ
ncbi:hypothetical protein vseg_021069 [Gypsophila vaccaria]